MNTPRVRSLADARLARNQDLQTTELIKETVEAITTLIRTIVLDWIAIRVKKQAKIREAMRDAAKSGDTTLENFLEGIESLLEERTTSTITALQEAAESTVPPWMTMMTECDLREAHGFLGTLVAVLPSWLRVPERDNRSLETIVTEMVALRMEHFRSNGLPQNAILEAAQRIEKKVQQMGETARRAGVDCGSDDIRKAQSAERFRATIQLLEDLGAVHI